MTVSRILIACVQVYKGDDPCGGLAAGWSLAWATQDDPSAEANGVSALVSATGAGADGLWEKLGIDSVGASGLRVIEVEVGKPSGVRDDWSHLRVLGDREPTPFEITAAMEERQGWRRR